MSNLGIKYTQEAAHWRIISYMKEILYAAAILKMIMHLTITIQDTQTTSAAEIQQ